MCKVTVISSKLLGHSGHWGISIYFFSFCYLFGNEYWSDIKNKRLQEDIMGGHEKKQNKICVFEGACYSLDGETDTFTH